MLSDEQVVVEAFPESWRSQPDGSVISKASSEGYTWLVTCDKRMPFQQNLDGRTIAVLILPTPRVPEVEKIQNNIRKILRKPVAGNFILLDSAGFPVGAPTPHLLGPVKRID
ncbi:MAG: hypothetical protein JNK47_23335 [Mesorhizobium sp.]|nr:hypothetical protein [Mesorhizobium sp.]MBL8580144.1 hypothetical protein [Mesorhizobium sp.]